MTYAAITFLVILLALFIAADHKPARSGHFGSGVLGRQYWANWRMFSNRASLSASVRNESEDYWR